MTCKDCLHGDMCEGYMPTDLDRDVWHYCREGKADQIPDIEERCASFKDRTKYVEVVRCKDCEYYESDECGNPHVFMSDGAHLYTDPSDFCSCGVKREEA